MSCIKPEPEVSHLSLQLTNEDEHLSAAAGGKTNLGGDGWALALPGIACLTPLDFEAARAFFQHPPRSVGALDRAQLVLEPSSRFDHEGLTGKQLLSMP